MINGMEVANVTRSERFQSSILQIIRDRTNGKRVRRKRTSIQKWGYSPITAGRQASESGGAFPHFVWFPVGIDLGTSFFQSDKMDTAQRRIALLKQQLEPELTHGSCPGKMNNRCPVGGYELVSSSHILIQHRIRFFRDCSKNLPFECV